MKFRYSLSCVDGKTNVLTVTRVFPISRRAPSILSTSLLNLSTFACSRMYSLLLTSLSLSIFAVEFSTPLGLVVIYFSLCFPTVSISTHFYLLYFFLMFFSLCFSTALHIFAEVINKNNSMPYVWLCSCLYTRESKETEEPDWRSDGIISIIPGLTAQNPSSPLRCFKQTQIHLKKCAYVKF